MSASKVRTDAVSHVFVDTTRSREAFERIDELLVRGWEATFCRALVMLGPSRSGKTQICTEWLRRRHETEPSFRAIITEVPPACTLASFAAQILENMGDPDPDYGTQNDRTRRIKTFASDVDLIIIDEVQRLIDERTDKVKKDVANWLTNVLNRRICPLLLVGERSAEMVFQDNLYLAGRTLGQVPVEPYDWHVQEDRLEFRTFLNMLDGQLGMAAASGLAAIDTALRIHSFADGRIGMAVLLVDEARAVARRRGQPKLTSEALAEAVDRLRVGKARGQPNPFRIEKPNAGGATAGHVRDAAPKKVGRRLAGVR